MENKSRNPVGLYTDLMMCSICRSEQICSDPFVVVGVVVVVVVSSSSSSLGC
jgi:hypothetical protein